MSDLIEELKRVHSCLFTDGWESHNLHSRVGLEILRLRAEITGLRADCVRKDDLLLAAVQDYNDVRQRTIEECAKVADAEMAKHNTGSGFDSHPAYSTAFAIAAAIRSLGKNAGRRAASEAALQSVENAQNVQKSQADRNSLGKEGSGRR